MMNGLQEIKTMGENSSYLLLCGVGGSTEEEEQSFDVDVWMMMADGGGKR